jgi:hypothetical protein
MANQFICSAVPSHSEGRFADVTNAGRDAVDATASGAQGIAGRVFRERSAGVRTIGAANCLRRNWPDGTRSGESFGGTGADGEVVWS